MNEQELTLLANLVARVGNAKSFGQTAIHLTEFEMEAVRNAALLVIRDSVSNGKNGREYKLEQEVATLTEVIAGQTRQVAELNEKLKRKRGPRKKNSLAEPIPEVPARTAEQAYES